MTWNYAYNPNIWPLMGTILLLLVLSAYSWRRRSVPGALPFAISGLLVGLWVTGSVMENTAVDVGAKIFWIKFESIWQLPANTAVTCFILEYTWPGRWLTRRNLALLSIMPFLQVSVILINDFYHLKWVDFALDGSRIIQQGQVIWFFLAYSYGLAIVNVIVFTWLFYRSPQHRWPVAIMLTGQFAARIIYTLDAAHIFHSTLPLDTLAVGFLYLVYTIVLFGFRLFDPSPLARQAVIEQLHSGMVVLDPQGRVIILNPAAERILKAPASQAKGQNIRELLPAYPDGHLAVPDGIESEISLEDGQDARFYTLSISSLKDWRGMEAGRVLMLRDVTQRKLAEAALKESQEIQRLIFENASDGIAIYEEYPETGKRRLLGCNERYAQMAGRSREELLAIGDPALVQKPLPPLPYAKPRDEINAAQSTGIFSWIRPDGRENIIEYSATSLRVGGRLLTIGLDRDVTEQQQTQTQILDQQRLLATLNERERMARELHDSIGQVLGYASFQLEAASKLIQESKTDAATPQLSRLAVIFRDAHADVREYILNLRSAPSVQQPFFSVVQRYLEGYTGNYDIQTRLTVSPDLGNEPFTPDARMQVFRIIQEALSNARKHSKARHVEVKFTAADEYICITIQDDGSGFEPDDVMTGSGGHFGLQFMRERAEQLGGCMRVDSSPGKGTCVIIEIPMNKDAENVRHDEADIRRTGDGK